MKEMVQESFSNDETSLIAGQINSKRENRAATRSGLFRRIWHVCRTQVLGFWDGSRSQQGLGCVLLYTCNACLVRLKSVDVLFITHLQRTSSEQITACRPWGVCWCLVIICKLDVRSYLAVALGVRTASSFEHRPRQSMEKVLELICKDQRAGMSPNSSSVGLLPDHIALVVFLFICVVLDNVFFWN